MTHRARFRLAMIAALLLASGCGTRIIDGAGPGATGGGGAGGGAGDACMVADDCTNVACDGKPVDCGEPPTPTCISATTLRSPIADGTCAEGACSRGHVDTEYPSGCSTAPHQARLSAGDLHTCAINSSGVLKCWGNNWAGELGGGTDIVDPVTAVIGLSSGVAAVAAGGTHTCAVTTTGALSCWGSASGANIAEPDKVWKPRSVTGLPAVIAAAVGNPMCGITLSGGVKCWDGNPAVLPVDVPGLASGIIDLAVGAAQSCALTATGAVKCWGRNLEGELGDGTAVDSVVPVDATGLSSGVVAIASSYNHTCALTGAGAVMCWGILQDDKDGASGYVSTPIPVEVAGLSSGVVAIAAGSAHSCAVTTAGAVKCWGYNAHGQLGDGTTGESMTPVDVVGLPSGVVAVTAGRSHTCALIDSGAVECWGDNTYGQLGSSGEGSLVPVDVKGF